MAAAMPGLGSLARRTDVLFALLFVLVVAMMVMPLPTPLVDALIAFNLAFAFIILVTAIYLKTVLDISTFPSVILIGTIFRLALTISTTRLVLSEGDAGEIIRAFGSFVVAGNVVVGMVMFLIVALVQFIVVTKGAERIAEVSARFTLDAIPGKQLAIDSDLRNGHITAEQAQGRRSRLEKESQFFGAMDGALRFVKGDAIAGLVIVAVNLLGGLTIGIFQRGMSFSESAELYSLLSIGDGLVSQIPSMLMAVAAGTVVTRVTADENTSLGTEIGRQLVKERKALGVSGAITAAAGLVPGFPTAILFLIGGGLVALAVLLERQSRGGAPATTKTVASGSSQNLDRAKYGDPVVATVSPETLERLEAMGLSAELEAQIRQAARLVGVAVTVPTFLVDARMPDDAIHLAVENAPAGVIAAGPDRAVGTIAGEVARLVRRHVGATFSVDDVAQWLASLEPRLGKLAVDVREQVPPMIMVAVMRRLIDSGVSLSQPRGFLETLLAAGPQERDPDVLAERARRALGRQVAFGLLDARGLLPVITMGAEWSEAARRYKDVSDRRAEAEAGETIRRLVQETSARLREANAGGRDPVAVVDGNIRLLSQALMIKHGCRIPVIAVEDIDGEITADVVATVGMKREEPA